MEELLERWAAEEPNKCLQKDDMWCVKVDNDLHCLLDFRHLGHSIQIATRQAIESHRWSYEEESIYFDALGGYVHYAIVEGVKRESVASKAKALLDAYLRALEPALAHR